VQTRYGSSLVLLFVLLMILAGCGSTKSASSGSAVPASSTPSESKPAETALQELTIATVSASGQSAPIYYAMEKGMFTKAGIKLNHVTLDPAASVAALISGDAQIVHAGPNVVDAAIKTDKVKVIGTYGELPMWVYSKSLTKLQDLKGKTIASTTPGGAVDYVIRTMIRSLGMEPGKDVKMLYAGNGAAVLATLSEGRVDAGLLIPPQTNQADEMGLKGIAYLNKMEGVRGQFGVMGVHQPYAQKNPKVIENYMKVYVEASNLIRKDKEAANAVVSKYAKITDTKILDASYEAYKELWPIDLHIPESEIQFLLEELSATNPKAKETKPADVMDNRYADSVK
jgi:ABC-type nitrate/sulfonate/bicarbonate transport system substrate-binding protein